MRHWLCIVILATAAPLAAKDKKATGEIPDRAAFAAIRSYCVNASHLPSDEAYEVRGFVEEEGKPRGLLAKLPWKLFPDCRGGETDAVIRVEFPLLKTFGVRLGEPPYPGEQSPNLYNTKAVLEVSDAASSRKLYHVQASPLDTRDPNSPTSTEDPPSVLRRKALYGAFWTLVEDVGRVSRAAAK